MAFRLKIDKPLKAGIRKAASKQLEGAIRRLESAPEDRLRAVHDIRIHLKKLRAVVRLIRGSLGPRYQLENACFRDVARQLSQQRDVQAVRDSFDALCECVRRQAEGDPATVDALCAVRDRLASRQAPAGDRVESEPSWTALADELRSAATRIAEWTNGIQGFGTLAAGLEEHYRRARRAMQLALEQPTAEILHEWRKQTKYHRYQGDLLEEAWPELLAARSKALARLSDLLGDDHDLVVLRERLLADSAALGAEAELALCIAAIDRRRAELFSEFKPLGQLIYAEKPKQLRRRFEKYWEIRRAESR